MNNTINYLSHITFDPLYYQRRYEYDLPTNVEVPKWVETAKRIVLIAVPFLSLHKPFGQTISVGMGTLRVFSQLLEIKVAVSRGCFSQIAISACTCIAIAATVFDFRLGCVFTTLMDLKNSLESLSQHLQNEDSGLVFEEFLQTLSSLFYLSTLLCSSLELILISILLQGLIGVYQSQLEWKQGRWPECLAKWVMSMIRFNQAYQQGQLIQKRNQLLASEKFTKLMEQIEKGRSASHLIYSPLHTIGSEVILIDANGNPYNFGTYIHGNGSKLVKDMNLQFRTRVVDGKDITELEFKINHVFRDQLQGVIEEINLFNPEEIREFLKITQSHAKDIKIEEIPFELSSKTGKTIGKAHKVTLEGLGSILIGNSPKYPNLFDRIRVEIDENKTLYECHELLSFFNLSDALKSSSAEDIERLKIGQLFRIYHPKEATLLERQEQFFNLPIDELKKEIFKQVPKMQETLDNYLSKMELKETLPGHGRYTLPEISQMVYELGGRALISTITGTDSSNQESFQRLASILKMGMLSTEMRYTNDMNFTGLSSEGDFRTGGADRVFTQFITEKNLQENIELRNFYWGNIRLLFSLDVLNTGTYQYHDDSFGTREINLNEELSINQYLKRPNIFDFAGQEQKEFGYSNEVMVKEIIPPSMIKGILVSSESTRSELLDYLRLNGLVNHCEGVETMLGIPIDQFVQTATYLSEKLAI